MYLQTIGEDEATGQIAEIYYKLRAQNGFVMEATKCFTTRPDLLPLYTDFIDKVRAGFSLGPREWRLITLIAAKRVPSTYCSHVFAKQLIADLGSKEAVLRIHRDFRHAGLPPRDVEMLSYAEKIAQNASQVSADDIERLRAAGFTDRQICDIAFCAAWRCFVARFFDATGAGPEPAYIDEDPDFRAAMTVGKNC
ncbi:carboxymuconolactone decarboxylase family protein [Taklimakanibacter lacteus]|uniref:carboxymuconolactone decarboxylase family protein n=1 Tax=Taklimakanibacter lacteus TaxID=2268456 RepID=UPI000E6684E5